MAATNGACASWRGCAARHLTCSHAGQVSEHRASCSRIDGAGALLRNKAWSLLIYCSVLPCCQKIHYMGMGVSGGEDGARNGPSLMPGRVCQLVDMGWTAEGPTCACLCACAGGPKAAYDRVSHILKKIAAQVNDGPCVFWIGPREYCTVCVSGECSVGLCRVGHCSVRCSWQPAWVTVDAMCWQVVPETTSKWCTMGSSTATCK